MAIDILREELLSLLGYPIVETAEDGTSSTLEAPVDTFENMDLVGAYVHILSGVGKGQVRAIVSHTDTILTVTPDWDVVPDETSVFAVEKPKRTIIDGVSDVQVTGSILADDGLGNPVPLTAVLDDGKYYLGTISMDFVEEGDPLG